MTKKVLGKGLDALIETSNLVEQPKEIIQLISLRNIVPNPYQPRRNFNDEQLKELADSIRQNGIVQPIIVRKADGKYEIIVGERRFRAARLVGIVEIPAVVKDYADDRLLELALIENIQREDLNPIEEAGAFKSIIDRDTITQEALSKRIGKSRSYIANMIRLLDLPEEIKRDVSRGTISVGHAKALLSLESRDEQINLANRITVQKLSVREVEGLVKRKNVSRGTRAVETNPYVMQLQETLIERLGTKVRIKYAHGKGTILIEYYSDEGLESLVTMLKAK